MDGEGAPHAKRKREQPNKKWKEREVLLIIEFLQEEAEFEAPTAEFFYKRFLEKSQLDASWELLRWKMRHLEAQGQKANDWLTSTGAGLLEEADGRTIEAKIAKMCPHFDQLREIFGKRVPAMQPFLVTSDATQSPSPQLCPASPSPFIEIEILDPTECETPSAAPSNAAPPTTPVSTPPSSFGRGRTSKFAIGQLAAVQAQKIALEKRKLLLKEKKFERHLEIEEKKLELEVKKMEMEDRWKILELEMK